MTLGERFFGFLVYIAMGLGLHILMYGEPNFNHAFVYVFMILWPVVVMWFFLYWTLVICGISAIIGSLWLGFHSVRIRSKLGIRNR
jgi:hypothetical protein